MSVLQGVCWHFKVKGVIQWTYHYEWRQALAKAHIVETRLSEMLGLFNMLAFSYGSFVVCDNKD